MIAYAVLQPRTSIFLSFILFDRKGASIILMLFTAHFTYAPSSLLISCLEVPFPERTHAFWGSRSEFSLRRLAFGSLTLHRLNSSTLRCLVFIHGVTTGSQMPSIAMWKTFRLVTMQTTYLLSTIVRLLDNLKPVLLSSNLQTTSVESTYRVRRFHFSINAHDFKPSALQHIQCFARIEKVLVATMERLRPNKPSRDEQTEYVN